MKFLTPLFALAAVATLPSCIPPFYELPAGTMHRARIVNTGIRHDSFKATVFKVDTINGKTSLATPMQTPPGGGPVVRTGESSVEIPANQPVTVALSAGDQFAADGPALLYSLGGNVTKPANATFTFTPKDRATYLVKGQLGKESSSVWLEDQATGKRVR